MLLLLSAFESSEGFEKRFYEILSCSGKLSEFSLELTGVDSLWALPFHRRVPRVFQMLLASAALAGSAPAQDLKASLLGTGSPGGSLCRQSSAIRTGCANADRPGPRRGREQSRSLLQSF